MAELWITHLNIRTRCAGAVSGQQAFAILLNTKSCAERATAVHNSTTWLVQVGRAWVLHVWVAPAWPWQAEVVARHVVASFFVHTSACAQGAHIKQMHIAHVRFQAVWALACVADGPETFVDFFQNGFDLWFAPLFAGKLGCQHGVVFGHFVTKTHFVCNGLHDDVVRQ